MRQTSLILRAMMNASESKEVLLFLLTLSHPNLVAPIRVVNDFQDVVSGGFTYSRFPFEVTLPWQKEDQVPTMKLSIDNVDRQIVTAVRNLQGPIDVELRGVVASQPDIVEFTYEGFQIKNVSYNQQTVDGDLRLEEIITEPFPQHTFVPSLWPGAFGSA